jgi:multidrug efflux system membrane fusion protein
LARAQSEIAAKNLEDAVVRAPVAAAISQRLIKAGESVGPHQPVFELVENDRVLLTIHVPESRIRELEQRQREIDLSRQAVGADGLPEDATFRAYVSLEGADPFGKPWPALQGEVYRIAVTADPRTSLFDVEVALDNREQLLRPGMVATASLVVDRIEGYRLPAESVIYRQNAAHAFTIASESGPMEMMLWELGPATFYRARRASLPRWIDQGDYVLAPRDDVALDWIVVRGQHRLADGQLVRPVGPAAEALARGVDSAAVSSDGAAAAGAAP